MDKTIEIFRNLGIIFGSIGGAVAVVKLIITPILKSYNSKKEEGTRFHKSLESKITDVGNSVNTMTKSIRLMQRERLESGYSIYVNALGYCPPGEKEILEMIYNDYTDSGENHIAKSYLKKLKETPDYPKELRA